MQLEHIKNKLANGSAQPQLPISTMKHITMLVPNIDLQERFVSFVRKIDKSKFAVQRGIEKLETLKAALMQEYFA